MMLALVTPTLRYPRSEEILLGVVIVSCWLGVLGMWRMRTPTQALHYIALPGFYGVLALAMAAFLEDGSSQISWKALLIACIICSINVVVTHASARAFRSRELGHWEPREGDPVEFVHDLATSEDVK